MTNKPTQYSKGDGAILSKSVASKRSKQAVPLPEVRMCSHPELYPTGWGQTKPEPTSMIGCIHNASCPTCGFGWGMHPHDFNCPDKLTKVTDLVATDKEPK